MKERTRILELAGLHSRILLENHNEDQLIHTFTTIVNEMRKDYKMWVATSMAQEVEKLSGLDGKPDNVTWKVIRSSPFYKVADAAYNSKWAKDGVLRTDHWKKAIDKAPHGSAEFKAMMDDRDPDADWNQYSHIVHRAPAAVINAAIEKESEYMTEMFHSAFIKKNTEKFTGIIKHRVIDKIHHKISPHLTGEMIVFFVDNASFRVSFSIITKVSNKGTWFNQFPTRFHDITLPDGTKIKSPSEARIKAEF